MANFKSRCRAGVCAGLAIPRSPRGGRAEAQVEIEQAIPSSKTSRPQIPAGFKLIAKKFGWRPRSINFDLGGGEYEIATQYLEDLGVENLVYDRFARSAAHNAKVLAVANRRGFDTVTLMNVLNVIKERASRHAVLDYLSKLADEARGKVAFIAVYYDPNGKRGLTSRPGVPREKQTWQEQRPLLTYLPEIKRHFRFTEVVGGKEGVVVASNDEEAFHALLSPHATRGAKKGRARPRAFNFERYKKDINALKIGKRLVQDTYLHKSAVSALGPAMQELVDHVEGLAGLQRQDWDLVKFSRVSPKVSLLVYPSFFADAFPVIEKSYTVDVASGTVKEAVYKKNPQILHRKETFLLPTHPRYAEFKRMTEQAEALGLFDEDLNRIGRIDYWNEVLARRGVRVVGNIIEKTRAARGRALG